MAPGRQVALSHFAAQRFNRLHRSSLLAVSIDLPPQPQATGRQYDERSS